MDTKINIGASPSLKQLVYENLRLRIINGELTPGMKLREEELSALMNISRAPVREALNMLERDGFVTIIPRKGAIVTEINEKDIYDIWTVRALLEPTAAKLAVPHIPKEKLEQMEQTFLQILKDPDDFEKYMESDLEIHTLFYDYVPNHFLSDVLRKMKDHSLRMRWNGEKKVPESQGKQFIILSTSEHLNIIKKMKDGDAQGVYDAVLYHINTSITRTTGQQE